jgi:hemolysin activation/secretion protein
MHLYRIFALLPALCLLCANALAQTANELQQRSQEQERRALEALQQRQKAIASPDVRLQDATAGLANRLLLAESPCFPIRELKLQTESPERWSWLLAYADGHATLDKPDPVQGQCVGVQGVQTIIDRLQNALIAHGYVTSRMVAPAQKLQTEQLTLQLLPGHVHEVRWAQGSGERGSRWNTVPVSAGEVLNLRDIEQALENFKRVPTAETGIDIEPAQEPGFSNLVIRHDQAHPFRLSAGMDDSGTRSTGKLQGNATLSYDNWWTLSDLLYVTVQGELGAKDPGPRGTYGRTMHYSVPWGYSLLSITLSQNRYHQTVAGANADVLYSGTSANSEVKLSRIFQRDAAGKTTASLKGFQRRSNNYIDDQEVEVQRRVVGGLEWGLGHRRAIDRATLEANLTYRAGTGAWGALPAPEEGFGEGTSRMRLWLIDASVQWPFEAAHQSWTWSSNWKAQYNKTPLTPQDRFSIGGRFTVRGFDGLSVLTAERGWLWRNELSLAAAQGTQVYAGIDHGHVAGASAQNLVGQNLTGLVLGWRGQYKRRQFDLFAGRPLHKPERFKTATETAGFSLSFSY